MKSVFIPPFLAGPNEFYAEIAAKKTSTEKAESLTSKGFEACCKGEATKAKSEGTHTKIQSFREG